MSGRRSKTLSMARFSLRALELGRRLNPPVDGVEKPRTRGECERARGGGPCPFVSCAWHLYLDVDPDTGSIKLNFPDREVWELEETCALDAADRGGLTLEDAGDLLNITRERLRQLEQKALKRLGDIGPELANHLDQEAA